MNEYGLSVTAGEIFEYGVTVLKQTIDLRERSEVESGIAKIAESFQSFDVVVNCDGILVLKTIFEQTEEDWDKVIDTNLKGMWLFSKTSAAYMIRTNVKGSIINISSATSSRPMANLLPYGASKAAVNHMTSGFAQGVDPMAYGLMPLYQALCLRKCRKNSARPKKERRPSQKSP